MTSTAGPGVSLMSEFAGLGYFAELPGVIWDIQRVGPSTGLPTRTSQADSLEAYSLSHGDTQHIVLLPGSVEECFHFGSEALDLAEIFQTPIFVLSDLDLGMNNWMSDPFPYPEKPIRRGKVLTAEQLNELKGNWGRYRDVDGDGIPYRTLPGTDHPAAAFFTRGSGHDADGRYSEKPQDYKAAMDRLAKKFETAKQYVPQAVVDRRPNMARPTFRCRSRDTSSRARRTWRRVTCACGRFRSRTRCMTSSPVTIASTSSNRTATARWRT
jgi:2-oxoglutarate ferredoxin oxidoreductase subunit alpha